jgi:enoyl-CoA hydratase/carnithine racemase
MITTTRNGDAFVLQMTDGENRINPTFLSSFNAALDEVESAEGPVVTILTGEGKFFSNGLDLDWMSTAPEGGALEVVNDLQKLFIRLMTLSVPLVAAINGHAFAGGGLIALSCDIRVMREDRGFFCLPESDIYIPFSQGMSDMTIAKLSPSTARDVMLSGRRYSAQEALAAGIVDAVIPESEVVAKSIELAQPFAGKSRDTVRTIKQRMYPQALESLAERIDLGL